MDRNAQKFKARVSLSFEVGDLLLAERRTRDLGFGGLTSLYFLVPHLIPCSLEYVATRYISICLCTRISDLTPVTQCAYHTAGEIPGTSLSVHVQ
jgi:hypothetical protein